MEKINELGKKQEEYVAELDKIIALREEFLKYKPKMLSFRFQFLSRIKNKLRELDKAIVILDKKIMPFLNIHSNIRDGEPHANKVIGVRASRDLVLSNLNKLEQDISNFENQQNFKKSLFIAVIALIVSIITTLPSLIELIKPLFSS